MKVFIFLLGAFFSTAVWGQHFEGKIVYSNSYSSKIPTVADDQFNSMLGSEQEYFIKDGNYKSVTNGTFVLWQLYNQKTNKLFTKMANSESVLWNDGSTNTDEVLKAELNKGVTNILGYSCDELILTCKSGVQKYYFNAKLSVDPKVFQNHRFANWYEFLSRSKALPLKMSIETEQFIFESVATEITPIKLEKSFFELPANTKTEKSPY